MFKLSVIIPFYKGQDFISNLLRSIFSAYKRPGHSIDLEILIIIDCSFDAPLLKQLIAKELVNNEDIGHIRIYKNEHNLGVAKSRNKGYLLSTGDYLHFIDQDDAITSDFFTGISPYLGKYDFLLTNALITSGKLQYKLYYLAPKIDLKNIIIKSFIRSPGQVVLNRTLMEGIVFPHAEQNFGADDKFFWIHLFKTNLHISAIYIKKSLYVARLHENNYSNNYKELSYSCMELWREFAPKFQQKPFKTWMQTDIRVQRFIVKDFHSAEEWFNCLVAYLAHKADLNSVIRFSTKQLNKIILSIKS